MRLEIIRDLRVSRRQREMAGLSQTVPFTGRHWTFDIEASVKLGEETTGQDGIILGQWSRVTLDAANGHIKVSDSSPP
ncbi:hypothetical protein RRG08_020193 [Elysia crispata]|uniref:Uncharacterized protein n=1 Tax=Elysia crispata TaxID=231223 RepID=A0AAE1DSB8_9GAST|nr:hypothetical protein RRG08_020193 [Elysia crispata]